MFHKFEIFHCHFWICGLYHKHFTIINDDSNAVKFGASLAGAARVVIYNHHMFIVQAIGIS